MPSKRGAELRKFVIDWLGGECKICGSKENLELDHIDGVTWDVRKVSAISRAWIYCWEADQGLLRVLCRKCNAIDGINKRWSESDKQLKLPL